MSAARLVVRICSSALLATLPVFAIFLVFLNVARGGLVTDFENVFYRAGEAILDGASPYPQLDDPVLAAGKAYVYPPLTAIVSAPLTVLDSQAAGFVVMALLTVGVLATLFVLDVRDWRCYGMALVWPPVISAIQTGNVTIPLALAAALTWRFRDRAVGCGVALGVSLATKLFLWPLVVWLAAMRRFRAALLSLAAGALVLVVSWAAIGFDALSRYLDLLERLQELEEEDGYTVYALALDLGVSSTVSRVLWAGVAVALLAGIAVFARRGDDRRAFVLAIAATLACSPIVWLHYFALLLLPVALSEPRLGAAWFAPLLMYGSTGTFNGTTLQTALTIVAAALTVGLALGPARWHAIRLGPVEASGVGRSAPRTPARQSS